MEKYPFPNVRKPSEKEAALGKSFTQVDMMHGEGGSSEYQPVLEHGWSSRQGNPFLLSDKEIR